MLHEAPKQTTETQQPQRGNVSELKQLLCVVRSKDARLQKLIYRAERWNTEDYRYICQDFDGRTYFSNDLDCDGVARWSLKAFMRFLKKHCDA